MYVIPHALSLFIVIQFYVIVLTMNHQWSKLEDQSKIHSTLWQSSSPLQKIRLS